MRKNKTPKKDQIKEMLYAYGNGDEFIYIHQDYIIRQIDKCWNKHGINECYKEFKETGSLEKFIYYYNRSDINL